MIPIPAGVRRVISEVHEEDEAERYRDDSAAKLKRLQDTPMAELSPDQPLDIPTTRPKWMGSRGYDTPDFTSTAEPTIVPDESDESRDLTGLGPAPTFSEELTRPATPESDVREAGFGSGGPEGGPLSEATIVDLKARREAQSAGAIREALIKQPGTPDDAAKDLDLAEQLGVNRGEVSANRKSYEFSKTARDLDALKKTAPRLRSWMDEARENLEISHDDTDNLSWWESAAAMAWNTPGALYSGIVGAGESILGVGQMGVDTADEMARSPSPALAAILGNAKEAQRLAKQGNLPRDPKNGLGAVSEAIGGVRSGVRDYKLSVTPQGNSDIESGYYSGLSSMATQAPLIALAVATGQPALATLGMTATTAGEAYSRTTDENPEMPFADRAGYALRQAGIEFATELGPNAIIVDALTKGTVKDAITGFVRSRIAEHMGEQGATALQDLDDWLTLNPKGTWQQYIEARPSAALQTFVATLVGVEGQMMAGKAAAAGARKLDEAAQDKRTDQLSKTFDAMAQGAKDSKLLKRLPQKYRDAVAQVTKDGPLESVRVQPEAFEELAQSAGVSTEQLAQAFRIDPADINSALTSGEDVVIPSGNYAAALQTAKKEIGVSGETIHAAFAPNMRLRADDFTAKEREAMKAVFEEEQAARAESGTKEQGFADSADRVRETIREQVASLKIFNTEAANTQAAIVGEMVTTLAERTGQDPETLWKEQGFDIVTSLMGEDQEAGASLPQSTARTPVPIDNIELDWASQDLEPRQFEAWKGAREGLSNEQIADRINEVEPDARVTALNVRGFISKARSMGYDVEKAATRSAADKTRRLIDLAARGISNQQIADRLYRDDGRPRDKILNSIKVLKSQRKAEIAARKDELAGALTQGERGTFTPRADRSIIRLFESSNLSTLVHEGAHWYLDTLWRMAQTESPHPFVLEQIAAILEWQGKSPNWTAMFSEGRFTEEGRDLQEAFAESFEIYLREGKAPTTALRSVFASFKAWLMRIYKSIGGGKFISSDGKTVIARAKMNDEIRQVFDRMLATDEAITAAQSGMARDSAAMAQALLAKGIITEKAVERTTARLAAARERAEAELMARLMEDYERNQKSWWNDEQRQIRREVQSEIDERPEQRAYAWLSGKGWRDTREAAAEASAEEADAMLSLAQADGYLGGDVVEAQEWLAARAKGLDMSAEARAARAKAQGFTTKAFHETRATPEQLNEGFDLDRREAASGDYVMPIGVFTKPGAGGIGVGTTQVPLLLNLGKTRTFADRAALEAHLREDPEYAALADAAVAAAAAFGEEISAAENAWKAAARGTAEWYSLNDKINQLLRAQEVASNYAAEEARVRATEVLRAEGLNSITVTKDDGLNGSSRRTKAIIVFNPKDIRSPDAAFDPEAAGSSRLLAQADGFFSDPVAARYTDLNATDESLKAMRAKMIEDGVVPVILLFRTTSGRVMAFLGDNGTNGYHHDAARAALGLGDLKLDHGVYNPRRWPTLEAMDEAGLHAWYGTSGTEQGDGAGESLAQSAGPSRQLDAMGFYSAAQEAAQRVPDNIWSMGWQAARNALAKGRGTSRPTFEELDQLGLDDAVAQAQREAGEPLKGSELRSVVMEIIDANRIMIERAEAIFDPAKARSIIRKMNKQQLWETLDASTRGWMANHLVSARVERGVRTFTLDTSDEGAIVLEFKESDLTLGYSGDPMRISSVDIPVYRRHSDRSATPLEIITIRPGYGGLDPKMFAAKDVLLESGIKYVLRDRIGQLFADLGEETVIRKTPREDMVDSVSLLDKGASGDRSPRLDPGDYDVDGEAKSGEVRMLLPTRFHDALTGSTHSGEPGEIINILWSVRKDADGNKSLFLRQLQSDEGQQLRQDKEAMQQSREDDIATYMSNGYTRAEAEEEVDNDINALSSVPLMARTSLWVNAGVRALVFEAAKQRMGSVSIPTARTSYAIQGNADAAQHYETNVRGALEKIARQMGSEVKVSSVQSAENPDGASVYTMQITPAMRARIASKGFPLFQSGADTKGRTAPPPSLPPMRLDLQAVKDQYGEEALANLPPEVAAYSASATDADQFLEVARDVRQTLKQKKPKSLWKYLSTGRVIGSGNDKISYRGIRDDGGELLKIIGEKKSAPGLISDKEDGKRVRSYTVEHAANVAWEAGYFNGPNPPTPAEFLDALRSDFDGQAPLYARADMETVSQIKAAEQWEQWFDQHGIDISESAETLRPKLETLLTSEQEGAIGPDEAAPFFKMPDGNALLQGLKEGPKRNELIRKETQRRMIEKHGDPFKDGTLMREAETYARNEIAERQIEIELEALAKAAGMQFAGNLAKQTAIDNLRTKQVREVLNYNQWLILEQRWGKKALEAATKGKFDEAARYKKFQILNLHMFRESRKLAEKIETTRKTLVAYGTKPRQKRLFAAGKEYAENMNSLLDDYQLRNETKAGEDKRVQRAAWIKAQLATIDPFASYQDTTKSAQEQQVEAAEAIERSRALANEQPSEAKGYKSLTVEEFMAVDAEASMIWKMATLADQFLKEGKRRRLTLAAEDVAAEIIANQPKEKPPEPIESDAPGEKVKRGVLKYFAMHRTMQSLANQFAGGKDGGEFWSYFVKPLNAAFAHLSTLRKQMGEDLTKLFGAYSSQEIARFYKDRQTFNLSSGSVALTTQGRLAVALNVGNEKNRQRLMDSMGWTLADIQTITDTLTKRDWDFVQATWDYLNTWFPEANRVHEAVHGAPMDKVEPLQVATRFGVYAGGYYPIAFDPELSSKSAQRKTEADAKSISGRVDARSAPSFSKKRVEGKVTLPLKLSVFDVITRHLDQVATSIATEEVLFDAGRLIRRPEVEDAIVKHHGRQIYNSIVNILVTTKFGMEGTSGILAHLRNGATVVGLGWKVATALLQPLGVSNSVVRVGGYWVAKGYARMGRDAATIQSSAKWVMERSEFMRHRRQSQSPELAALKDSIKKGGLTPRWLTQSMFALMSNTQFYSVDLPTWYAGWYKAKATGLDDAEAAAQADQAVIDSQGGGEIHQTAAIQTGAGTKYAAALRLLTNFMSYMVTTYNLTTQRARNADTVAKMAALTFDMVILLAIPVAGKMALDAWTKGGGDDDDELWEKYGREQAAFLMSPFVGISQVAGSMRGDDAFSYRGPAGLGIFAEATNAGKAAAELDFDQSFWRPANKVAGMMLHYPASQADLTFRGALALWNGETTNPAAIFFGPAPAN